MNIDVANQLRQIWINVVNGMPSESDIDAADSLGEIHDYDFYAVRDALILMGWSEERAENAVRCVGGAVNAMDYEPLAPGTSSFLKGTRPEIHYGQVWCDLCNKPCDFEETGMHNLFGKPDSDGYHCGVILLRAYCHEEVSDIEIAFQDARHNAGMRIVAFAGPLMLK